MNLPLKDFQIPLYQVPQSPCPVIMYKNKNGIKTVNIISGILISQTLYFFESAKNSNQNWFPFPQSNTPKFTPIYWTSR